MRSFFSAIPAGKLHEKKQKGLPPGPQRSQRKDKIILCISAGSVVLLKF
jgi:hypothetical protein